jgi:DNA-binding beta-propeller fold protein YncE
MHGYLMRMCVAAAAGVALSTVGVAGASASSAASPARQAARVGRAGTSLAAASPGAQLWAKRYNGTGNNADVATAVAASPTGGTVYVTGQSYGAYGTALVVDYATVAYNAATGAQQWVGRYHGPTGSLSNVPSAVAVSPDGKTVFVTGKSLMANGENDYATVAYNAANGQQLWAKGYNGPLNNDDEATAVAVSPTGGTAYVTGSSWGKVGGADYATIAYNAATGAQLWVKRYNDTANGADNANSVAVNPASGTVYVTGQSFGTTASGLDYVTVAYDASGAQQWVKRYNGPGHNTDDPHSVAVSPDGTAVYVTGQSWGGQAPAWDYATVAYNAGTGAQQWAKRYNGPGNAYDLASSVGVSPNSGTVYVTGQSAGTSTGADYATIAYNAGTGAQQWIARYNDTGNGADTATSLAVSPVSGTVYVTGQSFAPSGLYDYATVAYAPGGARQWVKRPAGSVQYPSSVAVSPTTGAVFVTGAKTGDYSTTAYQG